MNFVDLLWDRPERLSSVIVMDGASKIDVSIAVDVERSFARNVVKDCLRRSVVRAIVSSRASIQQRPRRIRVG